MAHENAGKLSDSVMNRYKSAEEFFAPQSAPVKVKFGTSGHRGKLGAGFSELHAAAIAQAVAKRHLEQGIKGAVLCGGDTRLMSRETAKICAEVLAANGIPALLPDFAVPTPVFSFAILNGKACAGLNGTASHNPPEDMGLKYNPATGGPADGAITAEIEKYANECLENPKLIKRAALAAAKADGLLREEDIVTPYLEAMSRQVDFGAIKRSGLRIGIHALGGASIRFYQTLSEKFGLGNLKLVDATLDPSFGFIPLDHDGKIRMDPSSQYPMSPLLRLLDKGGCDFAGASDPDADRFGAATPKGGLLSPNHALAIMLEYLLERRPGLPKTLKAARTIGTTHLLDRICAAAGREIFEANVGFKYFVDGLLKREYLLAGEESAGMSMHGWTTEKDGILAVLLLAEITAALGKDLSEIYSGITARHGAPQYRRIDAPMNDKTRARLKSLNATALSGVKTLAGEKVLKIRDTDGIKIYAQDCWALVRASGTEPIAKLYAETFKGSAHLDELIADGARIFGLES